MTIVTACPRRLLPLCVLGVAACGPRAGGTEAATPAPTGDRVSGIEALYRARTDSARLRFTEADVHFVSGMIVHHTQALVMAGLAPSHGAGAAVRTLSARIINAQRDEIAAMERWLRDRGQAVPDVHVDGTAMMIHGTAHHARMPGMLTQAQLDQLDGARGPEFDRLLLRFMIEHHRGAVIMVDTLFATDGAARSDALFKLASDIQVDQRTEIARMERMLDALSTTTPPP
jgi:uncharacterized protein (DUF305 family)